jgi:hypothetical protein
MACYVLVESHHLSTTLACGKREEESRREPLRKVVETLFVSLRGC